MSWKSDFLDGTYDDFLDSWQEKRKKRVDSIFKNIARVEVTFVGIDETKRKCIISPYCECGREVLADCYKGLTDREDPILLEREEDNLETF